MVCINTYRCVCISIICMDEYQRLWFVWFLFKRLKWYKNSGCGNGVVEFACAY